MALIDCGSCGEAVSEYANNCKHCGVDLFEGSIVDDFSKESDGGLWWKIPLCLIVLSTLVYMMFGSALGLRSDKQNVAGKQSTDNSQEPVSMPFVETPATPARNTNVTPARVNYRSRAQSVEQSHETRQAKFQREYADYQRLVKGESSVVRRAKLWRDLCSRWNVNPSDGVKLMWLGGKVVIVR